jgi:release factor glutamine methyltransferase
MQSIATQEKKWLCDEKYHGKKTPEYFKECILIDQGMPVAYLIGNIEFLNCVIDLEYRPLIPRPETEFWTDIFIKQNKQNKQNKHLKILDLFSGSGCIGIAAGKHLVSEIDFGDIDQKNISQIKKNITLNIPITKTNVFATNVFSHIPLGKYDYILANPPYIDNNKIAQVQNSVLDNEDHHALFADDMGLKYVYALIDHGHEYLNNNGEIWIEFDSWQTDLIDNYLEKNTIWNYSYLKDQYDKNRVLILVRRNKN